VIATFLLALVFLMTIFLGYILPSQKSLFNFPLSLSIFILSVFTFGFMAKDLKNFERDRAEKIYTIPVIFGPEKGRLIIGSLIFVIFLLTPFLFGHFDVLILPSFLAGTASFWLINRKNYSEKSLFLLYFSYGLFFVLTVF
jgi:4-hydroxybenzoate polyprenyltransferase